MRILVVAAAALSLTGCSSVVDGWLGNSDAAAFPPDRPVVASAVSAAPGTPAQQASCAEAAQARSGDAAVQGFDETVVQTVYNATYADCLKWAVRR